MKKQVLLLWTAMLLSSSWSIYAQTFSGGEGTEASPYLISSKEDMEELKASYSYPNILEEAHFLLTRDLTGSEDTLTFIGSSSFIFSGTFDGGGHEIAVNGTGIFSEIRNATIKNLGVSGRITSENHGGGSDGGCGTAIGSICGWAYYSDIINCYNIATILYTGGCNNMSGGICGAADFSNIIKCYNNGAIEISNGNKYSNTGGICGNNYNRVSHCFAANMVININTTHTDYGRISGNDDYSIIENCYANSAMLINGATVSSEDATSKDGKDALFSSFIDQSWIEENLGWDFDKVWKMSDINDPVYKGLPVLRKSSNSTTFVVSSGKSVTIYPNPVSTSFRIQGIAEKTPLTITDISGKIMLKQTVYSDEIIFVEHLPEGVYNICVADETVKMVKK